MPAENAKYYDIRSELFADAFSRGLRFDAYVSSGNEAQGRRWNSTLGELTLSEQQKQTAAGFVRRLNILVLSGIWCGDCARQGPMLHLIEQSSPLIECRYIESRAEPALQDELRIIGATRVPVVVMLSEDFFELSRFGDRTLAAYRRKAATESGPACAVGIGKPATEELGLEMAEWFELVERAQLLLRLAPSLRQRYGD